MCHFAADQDEKVQPDSQLKRLFTRFERNPTSGVTIERLELLSPAWQDLKCHSAKATFHGASLIPGKLLALPFLSQTSGYVALFTM